MKISLITVTYNNGKTLPDSFQSILSQDYKDIEYIIVDDLLSDSTLSVIKNHESQFMGRLKWISEKDNGIYDAMNKSICMVASDIIGILNLMKVLVPYRKPKNRWFYCSI